jgi:hypothetical protein
MDQVHVVRHKVLVEGRTQRSAKGASAIRASPRLLPCKPCGGNAERSVIAVALRDSYDRVKGSWNPVNRFGGHGRAYGGRWTMPLRHDVPHLDLMFRSKGRGYHNALTQAIGKPARVQHPPNSGLDCMSAAGSRPDRGFEDRWLQ